MVLLFVFASFSSAFFTQKILGSTDRGINTNHTAQEETEGKIIWEKLQTKQISCQDLSDENFSALGEYFMGLMAGASHQAMNNMMVQMMGGKGEEQMHVVMGKRLSGCDTTVSFPQQGLSFMPMMSMMGGWSTPSIFNQSNNPMMSFANNPMGWGAFGWIGWIFMVLWWVLIIAGIIALIKWLTNQKNNDKRKSPLDILKERYATGEIDKKEFEEKKKDLI